MRTAVYLNKFWEELNLVGPAWISKKISCFFHHIRRMLLFRSSLIARRVLGFSASTVFPPSFLLPYMLGTTWLPPMHVGLPHLVFCLYVYPCHELCSAYQKRKKNPYVEFTLFFAKQCIQPSAVSFYKYGNDHLGCIFLFSDSVIHFLLFPCLSWIKTKMFLAYKNALFFCL